MGVFGITGFIIEIWREGECRVRICQENEQEKNPDNLRSMLIVMGDAWRELCSEFGWVALWFGCRACSPECELSGV